MDHFKADDQSFNEGDLSRYHALTGWEIERMKARSAMNGFACCTGIFIIGIAIIWIIRWLMGV